LFSDYAEINTFESPSAIAQNLAFVPALTGLACPHWDRSATGMWIGLSLDTTPLMMVQAIIEGIAFRAAEVLAAMNDHAPLGGAISIDGGMTANPYFCQFLANVLDRDVAVPQLRELTALGTAMLASRDLEAREDRESLATVSQKPDVFHPVQDLGAYRQKFDEAIRRSKDWQEKSM